jgi:hypothetical protein
LHHLIIYKQTNFISFITSFSPEGLRTPLFSINASLGLKLR